jgi:hypothetical protein
MNHCFIHVIMKREGMESGELKSGDLPVVCAYYLREIGRSDDHMSQPFSCFDSS